MFGIGIAELLVIGVILLILVGAPLVLVAVVWSASRRKSAQNARR